MKMSTGCWGQRLMQVSSEPPGQSLRPPELVVTGAEVVVAGALTRKIYSSHLDTL